MVAMLGMVSLLVYGCQGTARAAPHAHLGRWGALSRALWVRGVEHGPIVCRGGCGGRRGGERRALHDPIVLMIVEMVLFMRVLSANIPVSAV